jgi:hypothetical protein
MVRCPSFVLEAAFLVHIAIDARVSDIEPGYYADGKFGIRIENLVLVRSVDTPNNFGGRGYLGFEHVTMVRLILYKTYRRL